MYYNEIHERFRWVQRKKKHNINILRPMMIYGLQLPPQPEMVLFNLLWTSFIWRTTAVGSTWTWFTLEIMIIMKYQALSPLNVLTLKHALLYVTSSEHVIVHTLWPSRARLLTIQTSIVSMSLFIFPPSHSLPRLFVVNLVCVESWTLHRDLWTNIKVIKPLTLDDWPLWNPQRLGAGVIFKLQAEDVHIKVLPGFNSTI